MLNVGEELVGAYLQYIKGCEFIQKNLYTDDVQGEIDVVGINLDKKELYVCEVAIHMGGIQYTKDNQPNNVAKLVEKFSKDIEYSQKYFKKYNIHFMLWTPVVKTPKKKGAKHNQMEDVLRVKKKLYKKYGIELDLIINENFYECIRELRAFALNETKDLKSPVMRVLQIEEHLNKFINKKHKWTNPRRVDKEAKCILPPSILEPMNIEPGETWIRFRARPYDEKAELEVTMK